MSRVNRSWTSGMASTEDWWAVWLGLALFAAGLASLAGLDLVGWMAKPRTWVEFSWAAVLQPAGKAYGAWHPLAALAMTYAVFTVLTGIGAAAMGLDLRRFLAGWTVLFFITWAAWIAGHEAHLKATGVDLDKYGIAWSLSLGGGAAYLLALAVGLAIGNFARPLAAFLREAARPEWYIKTAIVFLGIKIGLMSMQAAGFAFELAVAGVCAAFAAYLLFWPIMYAAARRLFRMPREWAACLASGISICGVSAAIATGGAIRARPVVPVMISMVIVVFAMVELLVLPGAFAWLAPGEPIVNGAALGLTVKTDGADAAYRMLRTRVFQKLMANDWNSLAITSPGDNHGKTLTALNLAISLAREVNYTVLLVDFDLKQPGIHKYLGLQPQFGISDFILHDTPLNRILINPGIERLVLLPGRESLVNSSEMLKSRKMVQLVNELKSRYPSRIIIFDLPPLLETDDALAFSPYVETILLVIEEGRTTQEEIEQSMSLLRETNLMGTVLNKSREVQKSNY